MPNPKLPADACEAFTASAPLHAQATMTPTDRAKAFCDSIGRTPPAALIDKDGGPSQEAMALCDETGLTLDWLYRGCLPPAPGEVPHHAA